MLEAPGLYPSSFESSRKNQMYFQRRPIQRIIYSEGIMFPSLSQSLVSGEYALISLGFSHSSGTVKRNELQGKQAALQLGNGSFLKRNQENVITNQEMMLAAIATSILSIQPASQETEFRDSFFR